MTSLVRALLEWLDAPAASQVRAAHSVLNHAAKALEIEDLEARIAALERAAGAIKS